MFRFPGLPEELNLQIDENKKEYEEQIEKKINEIIIESTQNILYLQYPSEDIIDGGGIFFLNKKEYTKFKNIYKNRGLDTVDLVIYLCPLNCENMSGYFFSIVIDQYNDNESKPSITLRRGYVQEVINILRKIAIDEYGADTLTDLMGKID